ncbi:MAG: hypothetical protein GQ574_16645 [Crocinitomix sp.]|nr:hypothetical protein [Crocinitomix sp.]
MNWALVSMGFGLGTFKFLLSHGITYGAFGEHGLKTLTEVYISTTVGAWFAMSIFFFSSGYLLKRSNAKRALAVKIALENGTEVKKKKVFTRTNKLIVWIKRSIGIYGVTLLAPLFLSIPIGSIICAKFYGHQKKTFPLMLIFTASYSALMCLIIYATQ